MHHVNLPICLRAAALQRAVESQLPDVFVEDLPLGKANVHLTAKPVGTPLLAFAKTPLRAATAGEQTLTLQCQLPMSILLERRGLLGGSAQGEIRVTLNTCVGLAQDWSLTVETSLVSYEWLELPELKIGAVAIGVGRLTDLLIDKGAVRGLRRLDAKLVADADLVGRLEKLAKTLSAPQSVPAPFPTYIVPRVKSLGLGAVDVSESGDLKFRLQAELTPRVAVGVLPQPDEPTLLLENAFQPALEQPLISLPVQVVMTAEALGEGLAKAAVGKTIEVRGRTIEVAQAEVRILPAAIAIELHVEGALAGTVTVHGAPVYDADLRGLDLLQPEVSLFTNSVLVNLIGSLFKRRMVSEVRKQLRAQSQESLRSAIPQLNQELKKGAQNAGLVLTGELERVVIERISPQRGVLLVDLRLLGGVALDVQQLLVPPNRVARLEKA